MAEYLKKEDDITKIMKESVSPPVTRNLGEKQDNDLITDLLDNSETLLKGIILSEILGKPKSKR